MPKYRVELEFWSPSDEEAETIQSALRDEAIRQTEPVPDWARAQGIATGEPEITRPICKIVPVASR